MINNRKEKEHLLVTALLEVADRTAVMDRHF